MFVLTSNPKLSTKSQAQNIPISSHMEDFYIMSGNTIPPFGNWDYADELSYTHYFSCATQAAAAAAGCNTYSSYSTGDLYAVDSSHCNTSSKKNQVMKEHRRQNVRTVYTTDQNHQQKQTMKQPRTKLNRARREATCHYAKPVDEDLYKIPPELIRAYKKKKMVGFFSRLVPTCIR